MSAISFICWPVGPHLSLLVASRTLISVSDAPLATLRLRPQRVSDAKGRPPAEKSIASTCSPSTVLLRAQWARKSDASGCANVRGNPGKKKSRRNERWHVHPAIRILGHRPNLLCHGKRAPPDKNKQNKRAPGLHAFARARLDHNQRIVHVQPVAGHADLAGVNRAAHTFTPHPSTHAPTLRTAA